jgi:hypothetical protein
MSDSPQQKITLEMLYSFLEEFRNNTNDRFKQIDKRFDQVDNRFVQIDNRFVQADKKIDDFKKEANQRFDKLENNMSADKERLEEVYDNQQKRIFGLIGMPLLSICA